MTRLFVRHILAFVLLVSCSCGERGVEWIRADSGTTQRLWAIHGSSANDIWAVGEFGAAVRWDGATWRAVDTGTSGDLVAVWAISPTTEARGPKAGSDSAAAAGSLMSGAAARPMSGWRCSSMAC